MSESSHHSDEIDKYLTNQMGTFEKGLFEHKLTQDADLRYDFEMRRKAIEMIEWQRAMDLKDYIKRNTPRKRVLTFWQEVALYSSAACLIFFVFAWVFLSTYNKDSELALNEKQIKRQQEAAALDSEFNEDNADFKHTASEPVNNGQSLPPLEPGISDSTVSLNKTAADAEGYAGTIADEAVSAESNEGDQYAIKSDLMILDTTFFASSISTPSAALDNKMAANPPAANDAGNRAPTAKEKKSAKPETMEGSIISKNSNVPIKVEFWQSPINYRGYKYNGLKIQLYGIASPSKIKFKMLNDELYMLLADQVYRIVKEDRYNSYWPETDKDILKILRQ